MAWATTVKALTRATEAMALAMAVADMQNNFHALKALTWETLYPFLVSSTSAHLGRLFCALLEGASPERRLAILVGPSKDKSFHNAQVAAHVERGL